MRIRARRARVPARGGPQLLSQKADRSQTWCARESREKVHQNQEDRCDTGVSSHQQISSTGRPEPKTRPDYVTIDVGGISVRQAQRCTGVMRCCLYIPKGEKFSLEVRWGIWYKRATEGIRMNEEASLLDGSGGGCLRQAQLAAEIAMLVEGNPDKSGFSYVTKSPLW